jgi:hypothetical protein
MDNEINDILELRLYGDGISPKIFKSKDVAELLTNFESALKHYIIANNPDADIDNLYLSPIGLKDESLGLQFSPNVKALFHAAFLAISTAISTNAYSTLPQKTISSLNEVQKIVRQKNCNAEFKINGEKFADINPNTKIELGSDVIKYETIIYPDVKRVGGNDPHVQIEIDGKRMSLNLTTDQAKLVSHRLYEEIGLKGIASYSRLDNRIVDFKVSEVLSSYNPSTIKDSFGSLKNIIGKYWDNIDDIDKSLLKE